MDVRIRIESGAGAAAASDRSAHPDRTPGHHAGKVVVKSTPPVKQAELVSLYGQGIFREDDVIEMGVENGAAPTSGARYTYGGRRQLEVPVGEPGRWRRHREEDQGQAQPRADGGRRDRRALAVSQL
jgi:hypothetical protein